MGLLDGFQEGNYKQRGLFPSGLTTGTSPSKQATAVLIKIHLHLLVFNKASKCCNKSNSFHYIWNRIKTNITNKTGK